ncbi:MAG TPA: hypothetical protein VK528_05540 [Flavobacterium sp.]|nr:hypothetical protein [Flavobacterium sp.]
MKTTMQLRICLMALATCLFLSCSSNKMSGSAADKTGANGATNGTGKIPSGTAHEQR